MTSSDGGWSLNVVYMVSSDGASIYIMYTRHHFATIICNYFGGSKLQPCGDTCQLLKYFNYISLNPSTFIQVVGFNTLGLSHVQVFPDRVGKDWPCFFRLTNGLLPHGMVLVFGKPNCDLEFSKSNGQEMATSFVFG